MANDKSLPAKLIAIVLIIITVSLFSYWGYQCVNYVLGQIFHVDTGSSLYDLFIGLIAMAASVPLFIGSIWVFRNKPATTLIVYGTIGFLIKNVLDIINDAYPLTKLTTVMASDISAAAWLIGIDFLQLAFWIAVWVYFAKHYKK